MPAQGTFFEVLRRLEVQQSTFTLVNAVGEKKYTDAAFPAGSGSACYTVRAKRGSLLSAGTDPIQVRFGAEAADAGEEQGGGGLALAA